MKKLMRAMGPLVAIVLLLAAGLAIPSGASAASAVSLDARIGGSQKSFEAAFGAPVKDKSSNEIQVYTVSGFGLVAAAFLNSRADEITIAADRLSHKPLTDANPADWTVTNAARFADAVVPTDATYGSPVKGKTKIELVGHSKALEAAFTQTSLDKLEVGGKPGDLDVVYNLDTAGNVFSVDVSMGNGTSKAAPTSTSKTTGSATKTTASATKATGSASSGNSVASGQVVHCRDFQTQADAQAYFDSHGGDSNSAVSGMDGDKDGKACETLP